MDFAALVRNVVSHFALATAIITAFVAGSAGAEQCKDWRGRAAFLLEWLSATVVAAWFWGASARIGGSLSAGVEAALTLVIPSVLGILHAWLPTRICYKDVEHRPSDHDC